MSRRVSVGAALVGALFALALLGACSSDEESDAGAEVYNQSCAACHGTDGQGGIGKPLGGGIVAEKYTLDEHRDIVMNGTDGGMPALGASLGEEKVNAVVTYEREVLGQ